MGGAGGGGDLSFFVKKKLHSKHVAEVTQKLTLLLGNAPKQVFTRRYGGAISTLALY